MPEIIEARRLSGFGATFRFAMRQKLRLGAQVAAYRVVADEQRPLNRRVKPRLRTRLRAGKLLDDKLRFIADCLVHDRAPQGFRIRIGAGVALPATIWFYDEERANLHQTQVRWRRGEEVGLWLVPNAPARMLTAAERAALGGRYYAMR